MPGPHRMTTEKPKNAKKSAVWMLKSLKKYRVLLTLAICAAIISTVLSVFGPLVLGNITTEAVSSITETGAVAWNKITPLFVLLISLYGASGLLGYFEAYLLGRLSGEYARDLRAQILAKINRLPISYFDQHQFGDTLSIMSNDVDAVTSSLRDSLTEIISNIILFIGTLVMMLLISPLLSLIAFVTIPISGFLIAKVAKKAQGFFVRQRKELGDLNSTIE